MSIYLDEKNPGKHKPFEGDITTSAKPAQVKAIFDHTIDTGIQQDRKSVV